jgi:hypothetical protein
MTCGHGDTPDVARDPNLDVLPMFVLRAVGGNWNRS